MSRRIIGSAFISLDGVIQGPGGPREDITGGFDQGGWVFKVWDEEVGEAVGSLFAEPYDLLLGRRTYDIFAAYWPFVRGEEAQMGEAFTRAEKHVLTRGDQPLDWENSHRLKNIADVAALRQSEGPDLVIQGSGTLYPLLLAHGLLDRLTLLTFPITLGTGKRLFGKHTPAGRLEMIDHKVTAKGTVIATYKPGLSLPPMPSDAPPAADSGREAERQSKMEAGTW